MARSLFVLCFLRLLLSVTHTFTQLDTSMSPSVSLSHTSLLIETSYLNRILIYIKISQSLHFRGNKVSMYLILSIYCVCCCCCCFMFYCFFCSLRTQAHSYTRLHDVQTHITLDHYSQANSSEYCFHMSSKRQQQQQLNRQRHLLEFVFRRIFCRLIQKMYRFDMKLVAFVCNRRDCICILSCDVDRG